MKTRCRLCAPSGIHRDSIMQLRTAMLAQMPTLTSRMAITCTIQQRRAGTTQQVSAHQTSRSSTMPYPAPWPKLRVGEPKSQELVISLYFDREHSICSSVRGCHTYQTKGDSEHDGKPAATGSFEAGCNRELE